MREPYFTDAEWSIVRSGINLMKENEHINESIEIETEYYAIGFKKGSELTQQINEKLLAYAQDGSLATLAQKYGLSGKIITDYTDQIN